MNNKKTFWIYILECDNGSYYTGYTKNLAARFRQHLAGRAGYTRGFKPVRIAQCWRLTGTAGAAMKVEEFIKGLKRAGKEVIVARPRKLASMLAGELAPGADLSPFNPARVEKASREMTPGELKVDPFVNVPVKRKPAGKAGGKKKSPLREARGDFYFHQWE